MSGIALRTARTGGSDRTGRTAQGMTCFTCWTHPALRAGGTGWTGCTLRADEIGPLVVYDLFLLWGCASRGKHRDCGEENGTSHFCYLCLWLIVHFVCFDPPPAFLEKLWGRGRGERG